MDYCEIFSASSALADLYVDYERTEQVSSRSALWHMHLSMFFEKICCSCFGMDGMLDELIKLKNSDASEINWESSEDISDSFRKVSVPFILFYDICALLMMKCLRTS